MDELRVVVAVPTFRRNHDLVELIPLLLDQVAEVVEQHPEVQAHVLIVDNDPDAGARSVVVGTDERVRYVHEPAPGLAAVRNRALDESSSERLLAFMDDDGRPAPDWLTALVRAWKSATPVAVAGRVLEEYEVPPDEWLVAGGFFRRRSLPTGVRVPTAPAGNLLLDLDAVRALDLHFDERFGLSGGEDTLLTRALARAGGGILWCEESRVVDQVPRDRMNRAWVLARARSHGAISVRVALVESPTAAGRALVRSRATVAGAARVVVGSLRALVGVAGGSLEHHARGLRLQRRGLGMIDGVMGHIGADYAR